MSFLRNHCGETKDKMQLLETSIRYYTQKISLEWIVNINGESP
jgi:hypothetical protein